MNTSTKEVRTISTSIPSKFNLDKASESLLDFLSHAKEDAENEILGMAEIYNGDLPQEYQHARSLIYKYLAFIEAEVRNTFEYNLFEMGST